jgi:hypothetical protein
MCYNVSFVFSFSLLWVKYHANHFVYQRYFIIALTIYFYPDEVQAWPRIPTRI